MNTATSHRLSYNWSTTITYPSPENGQMARFAVTVNFNDGSTQQLYWDVSRRSADMLSETFLAVANREGWVVGSDAGSVAK